jgi:hypothetical protein
MAADAELKRIYITGDSTPPPPPGFTIDAVPPVPPPPAGFVPDKTGLPYTPDVAPPPEGYVLDNDPLAQAPTEGSAQPMPSGKIAKVVAGMIKGIATLPQRAIENSQTSLDTGTYDPGPTLEAATLPMGTGAIAGVPVKGTEAVLGSGAIRRTPTTPPPPGFIPDAAPHAQALADDLQTLRQSSVADRAEVGNTIRALPEEAKTPEMGEKLYHAAENPADRANLTPEEQALSDQHLQPLRDEQAALAKEAKDLGGADLVEDPNYMHRIAKGHAPEYDSLSGDSLDPVAGTRSLPRTTSAMQERKFYAVESPDGTRKVVSASPDGVTVWNDKAPTNVATGGELVPGETIDLGGKPWKVTQATTKEIEKNTATEYHKNAFVSTADAVVRLREVVRNLKFVDEVKKSPWWLDHAQQIGGNKRAPKGWVEPKMPQFKGWYVDPKIAHVLDDFYKPGILDADNALRKINQFATSSMFWNPIGHMQNVGVHWSVARGWDWIKPGPLRHFATDMTRALKETVTQGPEYQRFLRQGGGLVYGGVKNADFYGDIGRHMGMDIEKHWGAWKPLANKLGLKKPYEFIAWWYSKMRNVLWATSDMFMMHRYLELERKGMSSAQAMKMAEKHIPNYRIPSEIMGSRTASQFAQEPAFTNFARYHYGMWKSFMHMATDLVKGSIAEKKEALGNVAALAVMGYVVYPVVNAIYQKVTGDPNAKMLARGAMSVPHGLAEISRDRESFSQFLQSNITPAPATKEILQQFFGTDFFTGKGITDPATRAEHAAKALVSPYGTTTQMTTGGEDARSAGRTALDTVVGGENTSEKTEHGKQYGAVLRQKAIKRRREKPSGPIEAGANAVEKAIGLAPEPAPKKEKKAKDPNAPKRSHHNKDKGY